MYVIRLFAHTSQYLVINQSQAYVAHLATQTVLMHEATTLCSGQGDWTLTWGSASGKLFAMLSTELSCFDTRSKASKLGGASLNAYTQASVLREILRQREKERERERLHIQFSSHLGLI